MQYLHRTKFLFLFYFTMDVLPGAVSDDDEILYAVLCALCDSDGEETPFKRQKNKGSRRGKAPDKARDFEGAYQRFKRMYFDPQPIYNDRDFRRRFRMRKTLFEKIYADMIIESTFFQQKSDCTGKCGVHPLIKIISALRMLCYGLAADALDENFQISETLSLQCLKKFCTTLVEFYGNKYSGPPKQDEIKRILRENSERGFPGMIGSLDCMHWAWKNCPKALAGQYQGKEKTPTFVLEAVATYDLRIWHYAFGFPGSLNDINVLQRSTLVPDLLKSRYREDFEVNGASRSLLYFLTDGIYPEYPFFVKALTLPKTMKESFFTKMQESCRKDVERAFGVLQQRFHILVRPSNLWFKEDIHHIMQACIILHNMIIEDEGPELAAEVPRADNVVELELLASREGVSRIELLSLNQEITDRSEYHRLRRDLIEHLWNRKGSL